MTASAHALQATAQPLPQADGPACSGHETFIRSLPCMACGKPAPSECAHVAGGMNLGLGASPDARYIVPLCGPATVWNDCCHSRLHYLGPRRFWSELGLDPLDLARNLWRISGNREAGLRAVMLALRQIAGRTGHGERRA